MLLDKLIEEDNVIWLELSAEPGAFEVSQHSVAQCRVAKRLLMCDHTRLTPFWGCESTVTGGRVPVVRGLSLERHRTKVVGDEEEERTPSHRVRVSEFLAASVSSHYFSSHDSSL